jgi:hypothetical protein
MSILATVSMYLFIAMISVLVLVLIYNIVLLIKNEVTFKQHERISVAIYRHHIHKLENNEFDYEVDYSDMESYDDTLNRLWDWGYTRILPPDKFEIIKPFLED